MVDSTDPDQKTVALDLFNEGNLFRRTRIKNYCKICIK